MTVLEPSMYSRYEMSPTRRAPTAGTAGPRSAGRLQRAIDATVTREIHAALRESAGNVVHAARALGISQPGMYKRLHALSIDPSKFRR
jgi:DNA-binding NtrC family response regulator